MDIQFVIIGRITKPHGVRGEVSVYPVTDDPQRFGLLSSVFIGNGEGQRERISLESVRVRSRDVILKFKTIDSRERAEKLRGCFVEIRREECLPLKEDEHYIFDLIGLQVITLDGKKVGLIEEVLDYPANDVYVVKSENGEVLIPAIKDVVKSIDVDHGVVTIDPIEGLLE